MRKCPSLKATAVDALVKPLIPTSTFIASPHLPIRHPSVWSLSSLCVWAPGHPGPPGYAMLMYIPRIRSLDTAPRSAKTVLSDQISGTKAI